MKSGMGSHQSSRMLKDEWLTPPEITKSLGEFDLDPCSPITRPWNTAKNHLTTEDDGLSAEWQGRVWLNPPYGRETGKWLKMLSSHSGGGIALIFARTDTEMFFKYVWKHAVSALFLKGRLHFYHADGTRSKLNSGAPSVLVAYSDYDGFCLRTSGLEGKYIQIR